MREEEGLRLDTPCFLNSASLVHSSPLPLPLSLPLPPSYQYAIYSVVVRGWCFCNGHALECDPPPGVLDPEPGMVWNTQAVNI